MQLQCKIALFSPGLSTLIKALEKLHKDIPVLHHVKYIALDHLGTVPFTAIFGLGHGIKRL